MNKLCIILQVQLVFGSVLNWKLYHNYTKHEDIPVRINLPDVGHSVESMNDFIYMMLIARMEIYFESTIFQKFLSNILDFKKTSFWRSKSSNTSSSIVIWTCAEICPAILITFSWQDLKKVDNDIQLLKSFCQLILK